MEELYLVYVHGFGTNYKDINFYEFIFSDKKDDIDGEGWDSYPANGDPQPPKKQIIKQMGVIEVKFELELAQNNEQFSMWDSIDGVIPLAWEKIEDEYPSVRLIFPFGMTLKDVEAALYERDIIIKYEKK